MIFSNRIEVDAYMIKMFSGNKEEFMGVLANEFARAFASEIAKMIGFEDVDGPHPTADLSPNVIFQASLLVVPPNQAKYAIKLLDLLRKGKYQEWLKGHIFAAISRLLTEGPEWFEGSLIDLGSVETVKQSGEFCVVRHKKYPAAVAVVKGSCNQGLILFT